MTLNISALSCKTLLALSIVFLIACTTVTVYKPLKYYGFLLEKEAPVNVTIFDSCILSETHREQLVYACLNWNILAKKNNGSNDNEDNTDLYHESQSTCNDAASRRGPHQHVVAFSFYGDIANGRHYFQGIEENAKLMEKFYHNWIMRVYHDIPPLMLNESLEKNIYVSEKKINNFTKKNWTEASKGNTDNATIKETPHEILCRLQCIYPNLDFCYIGHIPGFGNLLGSQGNIWRFLPMADPLVDVFVSRDLDSRPSDRELAAVNQWITSNKTFHIMRDNPYHRIEILAGMWGAAIYKEREKLDNLTRLMMNTGKHAKVKGFDQTILKNILWPIAAGSSMQHDSYTCTIFGKHHALNAWPTRRIPGEKYNFVGARVGVDMQPLSIPCPTQCRPKNHKHWVHC